MGGGARLGFGLALLATLGCGRFAAPPAWEALPPPPSDAPVVRSERLHRFVLPNGLRVLVLEDPRLPRVALGVRVRRGAAIVETERAGLAAFTAELMERGAGERDALALARAVDALGASLSVSAGWDAMGVRLSGLSRDLDALLELLRDVTLRPRFDTDEARRARAEQLAALEQAKDDPTTLAGWALRWALYPHQRRGLPRTGSPESVEALDADDARAFHRRVFTPGNAILYVVGDVQAQQLAGVLRASFGDWEPGPVPDPAPPGPAVTPDARRVIVVDRPELGQAQIVLGHEGISRTDPDRIAVRLLNTVIGGGGFSSRLMASARAEGGLTYGVHSSFVSRRQLGRFVVATFTRVAEVHRMIELLLSELERARVEPPTGEELANARSYATGRFALGLETSAAVAGALVELDLYGLPEDSLDTYRARIRAVTTDDTAREAARRLHPDRVVIAVVGPAAELVPQLESFGPVEVVQP